MKIPFAVLLFTILLLPCYAVKPGIQHKVSPRTMWLLTDLENSKGQVNPEMAVRYSLRLVNNTWYAGGLMMADPHTIDDALHRWNARAATRAGNIFTVRVPVQHLAGLAGETALTYFELDNKVYQNMDSARRLTGVDMVHQGLGLPQAYTGKGVIVAVIDNGFDYTHPAFFDSTGTVYRVKQVWDQHMGNTAAAAPADFGYGAEFTQAADILNEQYSDTVGSHGTHVSGIAAGSGRGTGGLYRGIACESDIVLVTLNTEFQASTIRDVVSGTTSGLLDAINYIFVYAQQQGQPVVVNMSLGAHIGPHDGTSLFDKACDALVGPGQILVGAAGNEGANNMHYATNFATDTATRVSNVAFAGSTGLGLLNAWGDFGTDFCMNLYLTHNTNSTTRVCASDNYNGNVVLRSSTGKTISVRMGTVAKSPLNNRPEILVEMQNHDVGNDTLVIELSSGKTGNNGTVHLWNAGAGKGAGFYNGFQGDIYYTMGEIGGTGKSIISVGAYNSKTYFTNIAGQPDSTNVAGAIGSTTSFSSHGPTVDGRTKPDICAPGNMLASSVSSFDKAYQPDGGQIKRVVDTLQGATTTWPYAMLYGTSMATPCVTGIVALLLQVKPNLTQAQVKTILRDNAIRDFAVTSHGPVPNNIWGYGKVNALQSLRTAVPVNEISPTTLLLYPNPATGYVTIMADDAPMQLQLCDLSGRQLQNRQTTGGTYQLDISNLSAGMYVLNIQQGNKIYTEKLVIE